MSEVGGHDESFLWETQSWAFSNSDNSAGGTHDNSGGKLPDSGSNTHTPRGKEEAVAVGPPPAGKKKSKNGKGSGGGEVSELGKGGGGGGESDHEIHIWTERERRKKMRNMFSSLHTLLPQLPPKVNSLRTLLPQLAPKADKSTIVDEAVSYIKSLQQTLQKLQRQKLERLHGLTPINNFDPLPRLAMDSRESFMADQVSSNNMAIVNPTNTNSSNALSVSRFPPVFQTWTSPNVILNACGDQAQINVCSIKKPGLFTNICCVLEKHKIDLVSAHVSTDQNLTTYMIQAHARITPDQLPEGFPVEEIYKQAAAEIMLWVSS